MCQECGNDPLDIMFVTEQTTGLLMRRLRKWYGAVDFSYSE